MPPLKKLYNVLSRVVAEEKSVLQLVQSDQYKNNRAALLKEGTMTIKWRLNVLMAERRLKNKDLTEVTGMHPVTISKLKNSQEVPERLERATLEKLCAALKCQPGDLMSWEPDPEAPEIHQPTYQENRHPKQKGSSASELRRGLSTEKPPQTSKSETTVEYQEQEQ